LNPEFVSGVDSNKVQENSLNMGVNDAVGWAVDDHV
jgi:hypothetical protein